MRQKSFTSFSIMFLKEAFFSGSVVILSLLCLGNYKAQGNNINVPGPAIARYALPSIPTPENGIKPTGTPVGAKAIELKKTLHDLANTSAAMVQSTRALYEQTIIEVNKYYYTIGEIEAKLQLGTTPGNPKLIDLRNKASDQLNQIAGTISKMDGLTKNFSKEAQQVKDLSSHITTTLHMPGAIEEDHAHLILMSDELSRLDGSLIRIINIINTNTQRQSEWLNYERAHFATLSSAIERGYFLPYSKESVAKVSYPNPSVPELSSSQQKVPHSHPKKQSHASSKSSLKPLPLVPNNEAAQENTKEEEPELQRTVSSKESKAPPVLSRRQSPDTTLPRTTVAPHPKVQPLVEESASSPSSHPKSNGGEIISYASARKDRTPLGVLHPNQDPRNQQWYLLSAAKRGIKRPTDIIEIVSIINGNNSLQRGENVRALLIEKGFEPKQIRIINAKDPEQQIGTIYIFGSK